MKKLKRFFKENLYIFVLGGIYLFVLLSGYYIGRSDGLDMAQKKVQKYYVTLDVENHKVIVNLMNYETKHVINILKWNTEGWEFGTTDRMGLNLDVIFYNIVLGNESIPFDRVYDVSTEDKEIENE